MARDMHPHPRRLELMIRWVLIILGAILLALLIFFIAQYRSLRREQLITARHFAISQLLERHTPLPVSDAAVVVRSWMTFEYLNKVFALPPDYLRIQLNISDISYPKLTISGYVKNTNLNEAAFLNQIDTAIQHYATTSTPTRTSPSSSQI